MRVLLADDDPDIRLVLSAMMARRGWSVVTANHGEEALARLADTDVDAAILDQQMPPVLGMEVAHEARRRGLTLPLVLCTGWSGTVDRDEADRLDVVVADKTQLSATVQLLADLLDHA
ncbi:response regulator [Nocardioides rubriscoriae]|uniref:response regulator n=1 Tax=Nocardioides rubriscoriae TaxID=642762 RepID=UPI0011E02AD1|nr:response regulator [Nocardioides rubriscoriae]